MKIKIVEKNNPLAVHALFDSRSRAEKHLRETIPEYVAKGYFTNKALKPGDFVIVEEGK